MRPSYVSAGLLAVSGALASAHVDSLVARQLPSEISEALETEPCSAQCEAFAEIIFWCLPPDPEPIVSEPPVVRRQTSDPPRCECVPETQSLYARCIECLGPLIESGQAILPDDVTLADFEASVNRHMGPVCRGPIAGPSAGPTSLPPTNSLPATGIPTSAPGTPTPSGTGAPSVPGGPRPTDDSPTGNNPPNGGSGNSGSRSTSSGCLLPLFISAALTATFMFS
ncbi:hypothetical protein FA15DRAFT_674824 [Coprinopsis marcescibilis]|uniref:Uncharacterized protein n=1 Tax=Coprinopsis marcescibilis TaxID=230819 RepID=A0A5C3KG66_COPMA|nr:hypothetical protein FA15DRAFT_674824 [Coprinopsis marcescibilis]